MAETTAFQLNSFQPTAFAVGYTLSYTSGVYTLTGNVVTILHNDIEDVQSGVYTLTGNAANLTYIPGSVPTFYAGAFNAGAFAVGNRTMFIDAGNYTYTGYSAKYGIGRAAATGVYTLTGIAANFELTEPADTGAYTLSGVSASLLHGRKAYPVTGQYAIYGYASDLYEAHRVYPATGEYTVIGYEGNFAITEPAETGSYIVSGKSVTFNIGMPISKGGYTYVGYEVNFHIVENIDTGTYNLTGKNVGVQYNPALLPVTGDYTLVGVAGNFEITEPADVAIYVITGNDVAVNVNKIWHIPKGSYAWTVKLVPMETSHDRVLYTPIGRYNTTFQSYVALTLHAMFTVKGVYNLTGNSVDQYHNHRLSISLQTYNFTNYSVNFHINFHLEPIRYLLDGHDAARLVTRLPLLSGALQYLGYPAQFGIGFGLISEPYQIKSYTVDLQKKSFVAAAKGSFSAVGNNVGLYKSQFINANNGAYTFIGKPITNSYVRAIAVAKGVYSLTGVAVAERDNRVIYGAKGTYLISSVGIRFVKSSILSFDKDVDVIYIPAENRVIRVSA